MLSFFRRIVHSRVGAVITLGVLALIGLAFAVGDIPALRMAGPTGVQNNSLATVGKGSVSDTDLRDAIRSAIDRERQRNPGITIAQFLSLGGFEMVLDRAINQLAIEQFGTDNGIVVNKRTVDGDIASAPAFRDPMTGQFNQKTYETVLRQLRLTDAKVRDDIRSELYAQWLLSPLQGTGPAAQQLALPYASLLLERRQGNVAFLPGPAFGPGPAPTEAELTGFYNSHHDLFTVPERRILRYAVVTPDRIAVNPTEAELQAAYKNAGSRFAATEKRSIRQVVLLDQKSADALAAKVRGGTTLADAAKQAGLEPTSFADTGKDDYARQSSPAVADAAFGAAKGAVVGPIRSRLGWVVLTVDAITEIPSKSFAQARAELTAELIKSTQTAMLNQTQLALNNGIGHSTFDELVNDQKLKAEQTPALTPDGSNPDDPQWKLPPTLAPVLRAGFAAAAGSDPQLVPLGQDGSFAMVKLEKIVPPRLRPLAEAREDVTRQFLTDRALKAARQAAVKLVAAVDGGKPLAAAVQAAGIRGAKVEPIDVTRAQIAAAGPNVPPAIMLLFSIPAGRARLIEAPQRAGYIVVQLAKIDSGDATKQPKVIDDARAGLGSVIGNELTEQFVAAMRRSVGVTRNATAIKQVRDSLASQGAGD